MNAAKKRYERLKSDGRCVICTATAAGGVWCLSCAAKAKQRRADIFREWALPNLRAAFVYGCPR